jgi:general secretion pathway protein N
MIDALRPGSALLAALALWSLGLLVLALAGLGGRVGPHPGNAALMPALPVFSLEAVGARLGPASDYAEVGNRPLLSGDRRPAPITDDGSTAPVPMDVQLTSVLIVGELRMAILQDRADGRSRRVRVGELVEGTAWRLEELQPRRAVFSGPEGRRELELRVYDGTGGAAPTAQASAVTAAGEPTAAAPGSATAPGAATAPGGQVVAAAPGQAVSTPAAPAQEPPSPDAQVEAIRRRIEARRAQRAAEVAAEQAAAERANR